MRNNGPQFRTKLAETDQDFVAAQRLRYDVFVSELGAGGALVDHDNRLERDALDPYFDHLLLIDDARSDVMGGVVGVYRLLPAHKEIALGRYYSEDEYDIGRLRRSGLKLLELGRTCLHPNYRGSTALFVLWQALADYVAAHEIDLLFGVASFHGTDIGSLAPALSLLYHKHRAEDDLCPSAKGKNSVDMNLIPYQDIDRKAAMVQVPSLIKAYLRLGGRVGQGAFIDHNFNTTDVCMVLNTQTMTVKQRQLYER